MAYPIDGSSFSQKGQSDGTTGEFTVTLPSLQQDDIIIFNCEPDTGTLSSVVGDNSGVWTKLYDVNHGGNYMIVYCSTVGATPDTEITVTTSVTNQNYSFSGFAIRDADVSGGGTTWIDASTSATRSSARSHIAPDLTTVSNDCLVVIAQGSGKGAAIKPREGVYLESQMQEATRSYVSLCTTYQQTAGAIGTTKYFLGDKDARSANFYIFSVKNKSGGSIMGYCDKTSRAFEYLHIMMNKGYSGDLGDNVKYDPSTTNETISSLTNGSYTTSATDDFFSASSTKDILEIGAETPRVYSANGDGTMLLFGTGITETYGSIDNYDLSGEKIITVCKMGTSDLKSRFNIGTCFGLGDKTNARFWQVGSLDTLPQVTDGYYPTIIDIDDSTFVMDDHGTPNTSSIGSILWGCESTAGYAYFHLGSASIMRYIPLVGGSTGIPCSFMTAERIAKKAAIFTVQRQGGMSSGQFFISHDIELGGSEGLYFDCTNESCEWPSSYDSDSGSLNFKIGAATIELSVDANSGDTINMSTGVFNFANEHKFTMQATSHNSDIYTFTGRTIIGATVTLQNLSNVDYGGLTFDSCREIALNGADISGSTTKGRVTISNGVDTNSIAPLVGATQAALQTLVDGLANVTFLNNNVAIRVEYTGTGDITLNFNNVTTTGNTTDIHYNSTNSSALTANMQNGSNLSTTAISGSATGVTIANDITATINVNVSGAEITILTAGTQTELFHVETASTSEAYVYTYSSDFNGDIQVYKPGYKPYWLASNVFSNSNQTITVNLDEDPASQI